MQNLKKNLVNLLKTKLPLKYFKLLKMMYLKASSSNLENEIKKEKLVKIGELDLYAPSNHLVHTINIHQPFRDECLGVIAKIMSTHYPSRKVLDIGANIGDSCAQIRKFSKVEIHCIEPHDIFFNYLKQNMEVLENIGSIHQIFIGDGTYFRGTLINTSESTARFIENEFSKTIKTVKIEDIGITDIGLIKIDTDGYDFPIILSSLQYLSSNTPLVFFENEIRNSNTEANSNEVIDALYEIVYRYWIIFDDPGYFLLSASTKESLYDLNRYLRKTWENDENKRIYNYDILAIPENDKIIFDQIREYYLLN
ncbi:MAG: FkbM family methyltransferase [Dolichospermum sp. DET73]|nr:FkbM family methyltransferase [Dolichospermum sp. DET73]